MIVFARPRVELRGRLVGDQEPRLVRERAGDRDALLLAAGQLLRAVVHPVGRDRPAAAARARGSPAPPDRPCAGGAAPRRSRRRSGSGSGRSLEDEADRVAAVLDELGLRQRRDIDPVHERRSRTSAGRVRRSCSGTSSCPNPSGRGRRTARPCGDRDRDGASDRVRRSRATAVLLRSRRPRWTRWLSHDADPPPGRIDDVVGLEREPHPALERERLDVIARQLQPACAIEHRQLLGDQLSRPVGGRRRSVSVAVRPSRMPIVRSTCSETSGSWVTTTTVDPELVVTPPAASEQVRRGRRCRARRSARPRAARSGCSRARPRSATRCCSPPESAVRPVLRRSPSPTSSSSRRHAPARDPRADALERHRQLDVLRGGQVRQQVARGLLPDEADQRRRYSVRSRRPLWTSRSWPSTSTRARRSACPARRGCSAASTCRCRTRRRSRPARRRRRPGRAPGARPPRGRPPCRS